MTEDRMSETPRSNGAAAVEARLSGEAGPAPNVTVRKPIYRRPVALVILIVLLVGGAVGTGYWLYARQWEDTDDAFIDGNVIPVGTKVAGIVATVQVNDNQAVSAGDVLANIDPRDLQAKLAEARATLEAAQADADAARANVDLTRATTAAALTQGQAGVESAKSQLASAEADVSAAQAESTRREADAKRYTSVDPRGVSQEQLDASRAAAGAARAQLLAAQKRVAAAEAQVSEAQGKLAAARTAAQQIAAAQAKARSAEARVSQAKADVDAATLDVSYTTIKAPVAGRVTRKSVQPGQYLQVGQTLLAIVPRDLWVTANFKETQLTQMRVGQPVDIHVDAFPDHAFHGHVDSIQAGTGARFSLLPPENATGNYVKVVQRVPVKIVFDGHEDDEVRRMLGLGMSVLPEVHVSENPNGGNAAERRDGNRQSASNGSDE
jgi:membrane fusion protein (multidrug efflux system)